MDLTTNELFTGVDVEAIRQLTAKHKDGPLKNPSWLKFCSVGLYGRLAVDWANYLRLERAPPRLKIVDLGCGFGYFVRCCKVLGHQAIGLDIDAPLYRDAWKLLDVNVLTHFITLDTSLPDALNDADLITMVGFGLPRMDSTDDAIYEKDDINWSHYSIMLDNIIGKLKRPGGRLVCKLNVGREWLFDESNWNALAKKHNCGFRRPTRLTFHVKRK